ncbi:hypothetical protein A7U60_g3770 [Sanghuangporus baumii]|uniref:F-box domain-containing protein n=1 Tax=Sanghuangporus baumii TaxID=108892 RepID=A0A9Q5N6D6_SANBA|nr:hypothetical protein A7U60_g3770 [Sanghuangporus baumii]
MSGLYIDFLLDEHDPQSLSSADEENTAMAIEDEIPNSQHSSTSCVSGNITDTGTQLIPMPMIAPTGHSPLNKLPIELLILIFSFCIEDDPDVAASLSLVNSQWRAIMTDLPSLWSHLRLSDARFEPRRLRSKADVWLNRSGKLPLDIDFDTRHRDSVLPLLSYALRGAPKWRNVSYLYSRIRFLTVKDGEEPQLESLLVTLSPKKSMESDLQVLSPDDENSTRTWWGGRDVPLVKNFKADDERLREMYVLGVRCLPSPENVAAFETVTSLVLMNSSTECDFPMHRAVPFLSAFPALQSLELSNFNELFLVHDPEYRPDCAEIKPAELTQLRRLSVRGICSSRCILTHLRAPQLQSLILIHINSSTMFEHPNPGEPGDSEDEAHDFSRSPWTDHATGMGLRKLFSSRNGHSSGALELKELVMDYADLRTKDFKWLFGRLPKLEKFTIVASDMSDNVMRALEVDVPGVSINVDDLNGIDSNGADQWRRPSRPPVLPSLTRLKFSKCQKMTGEAVVRMIRSRVLAAQRGLVVRFEELSTTDCLQVTEAHHQQIQSFFPPEARLIYAPGFEEEE